MFNPTVNGSASRLSNPDATRRNVEQYVLAFDSDLAPIVGQQVTLNSTNPRAARPAHRLCSSSAPRAPFTSKVLGGDVTECDLVASVVRNGAVRSYLYAPAAQAFTAASGSSLTDAALRTMAAIPGKEVTFTCLPPGSGTRVVSSHRPTSRQHAPRAGAARGACMLDAAQRFLTHAPWMAIWPGLAIFLVVLSLTLLATARAMRWIHGAR